MDWDDFEDPFEKMEDEEDKKYQKLIEEYEERERKTREEEERKEELTKKVTSEKEEEKLSQKADDIKKLHALDYWMRCFNKSSYKNEIVGQALFHVVLGQALATQKIESEDGSMLDWRMHLCWIQSSGSGKGKATGFVERVFSHPRFLRRRKDVVTGLPILAKYKTHKLGRMTSASLINTLRKDKRGLVEKDKRSGKEVIKEGVVQREDFVYSEEGRVLLEDTAEGKELQEILMIAMETIGSTGNIYNKTLTDYTETCPTTSTSSFVITTRPFGQIKHTLVESGMVQRFMFYPRSLAFEDRKEMNKLSSFSFRKDPNNTFKKDFEVMIDEINKIIDFVLNGSVEFNPETQDDLLPFLYERQQILTYEIESTIPNLEEKSILNSIISRFKDNIAKMAHHSAAMRFSRFVEKQDMQYAYDFFMEIFKAQKIWMGDHIQEDWKAKKSRMELKDLVSKYIIAKNVDVPLDDMVNIVARRMEKSDVSAMYMLEQLSAGAHPIIQIVEKSGRKVVKLNTF